MAADTTNAKVAALKERHRAEVRAVQLLDGAEAAVRQARERRAAVLARLDAEVSAAQRGHDVALAVLAELMPEQAAADIVGVEVAVVRAVRKRVGADDVRAAVAELGKPRRAGGRRGRGPAVRADRAA